MKNYIDRLYSGEKLHCSCGGKLDLFDEYNETLFCTDCESIIDKYGNKHIDYSGLYAELRED